MDELTQYTFKGLDDALNTELQMQDRLAWQMADSFVRTGYYLRVAQDTDILTGSGYESVEDYGLRRFGLDKSRVSRYININKEYSKDGYSMELQDRYQGFGWSKLALMLSLPEAVREEISPAYTKSEIQTIKDEVDEESKISDIEVMLEEPQKAQIELDTTLEKVMYQILHDHQDIFAQAYELLVETVLDDTELEKLRDIFVEDDEACYSVRIAGQGKYQIFMRGLKDPATIVSIRTGERESVEWADIEKAVEALVFDEDSNPQNVVEAYIAVYGELFGNAGQTGNEPKNTSKVKTAAKPHNDLAEEAAENTTKNEKENENSQDSQTNPPESTENGEYYHDGTIYEEPQPRISTSQDPILDSDGNAVREEVEHDAEKTQQEEPAGQQDTTEDTIRQQEKAALAWKNLRTLANRIAAELPAFYKYCNKTKLRGVRAHAEVMVTVIDRFLNDDYGVTLEEG